MNNTKIDWADMTWNPVTGCLHGCEYCYARRIAERFCGWYNAHAGRNSFLSPCEEPAVINKPMQVKRGNGKLVQAPFPFGFAPTFHRYRLGEPQKWKKPQTIFVCSMADLFGRWVPTSWIRDVFDACLAAPQHNYLFLTKNPERYMELDKLALLPRQENFWYGTTVTRDGQPYFYSDVHNTFVSVEPMMGPVFPSEIGICVDWVIVGAETGNRADKVKPERAWVEQLLADCRTEDVPLFMKGNLAEVWGGELVQELPEGLLRED